MGILPDVNQFAMHLMQMRGADNVTDDQFQRIERVSLEMAAPLVQLMQLFVHPWLILLSRPLLKLRPSQLMQPPTADSTHPLDLGPCRLPRARADHEPLDVVKATRCHLTH